MSRSRTSAKRRIASRAAALACAPLLALGALSITSTGAVAADATEYPAELVPVQITGDPSERFSLVIMGDGYTKEDMPKYREQVEEHMNVLWSIEPYKSYRNYFNVYSIEIESPESGVDCDRTLDAPKYDTALDMAFWGGCNENSVERLLVVNNNLAQQYAALAPKYDQIVAIGNSDTYGGAGGAYATASGGNALSALITPHEIGHSLGKLQDEYDYYDRGVTTGDYTGEEPSSKHHTILTEEQMREQQVKWWRWLGEESESGGKIGVHEGGMYYSTGVSRPSRHSQMKTLGYAYDQVSREIMTERISSRIALVTGSTSQDAPVASNEVLWVETAQPVYHDLSVSWAVNGEAVADSENARTLDLEALEVVDGDTITATVVDDTEFVRDPELRDSASMTQIAEWTVEGTLDEVDPTVPAVTLGSPTDRLTGGQEVLYVNTAHARDRAFVTSWDVDGEPTGVTGHSLDLAALTLTGGTHIVTATITDPEGAGDPVAMNWTVDNGDPVVDFNVTGPELTVDKSGAEPHFTTEEELNMELMAADDNDGYVVTEFRLDGDGWHNYYGWPTDRTAPFKFTPTGTTVDDLVYGNLGTGGMSLSPFQEREPGYGDHRVEYRAIDAAGNIGGYGAFTFTLYQDGETPAAPEVPEEPEAPEEPESPEVPEEPEAPEAPESPEAPGSAESPESPESGKPDESLAATGGESQLWLVGAGALATAIGLGLVARRRRRV